ncbi:MAG: hypothetical protein ACO349_06850, partial [Flavobacteriaceae bacterium]
MKFFLNEKESYLNITVKDNGIGIKASQKLKRQNNKTDQVSITPWKSSATGTLYTVDALVSHEGALYKNLSGANSTVSPDFDISNRLRISELTIDSLQATDTTASLSANQGRILNQLILALNKVPETQ